MNLFLLVATSIHVVVAILRYSISKKLFWNLYKLDILQKTDLPESGVDLQRSLA